MAGRLRRMLKPSMQSLQDLRLAVRRLLKAPGYSVAAVAMLALALAANSAAVGIVYAVLLRPLPITSPNDLVIAWETDPARTTPVVELPYRLVEHWQRHATSFSHVAGMGSSLWPAILKGRDEPVRVSTSGVTGSFFTTLGITPHIGRLLTSDDDVADAGDVAVLSHAAWTRLFGGRTDVLGTVVDLDRPRMVVGVMPHDFDYPRGTEFWLPVTSVLRGVAGPGFNPFEDAGVLFAIGRLREGVSRDVAQAELDALARVPVSAGAPFRFGTSVVTQAFTDHALGPVRVALWAVWAAVGGLLLITCANVSGLMLGRAAARQREHAVRFTLGASPLDVRRMWALESLVLATAGGLVGWLLAAPLLRVVVALAPGDVPRLSDASLNLPSGVVTVAGVLLAALLCAMSPMSGAASGHANLAAALAGAGRVSSGRRAVRLRSLLVTFQIALAVVLLVTSGLVVRSFNALRSLDVGFSPHNTVAMFVGAPSNGWMQQLIERLESSPLVTAAGAVYLRPLELGPIGQEATIVLEGQVDTPEARRSNPTLNYQIASPHLFEAMGVRLVSGRVFSAADDARATRVVVVSEGAAARLWPGQNAIGQRVLLPSAGGESPETTWRTVVGVVAAVHYRGLGDVRLDVYEPALQAQSTAAYLIVNTSAALLDVVALVRSEAQQMDAGVVVDSIMTLDSVVERAVAPWRFTSWMLTMLAMFGCGVAALGLFAVVSLEARARRHELAVRAAVGAERHDLVVHLVVPAAWCAVAGMAIGGVGAWMSTRGIRSLLFGVTPVDPLTWTAVLVLVVAAVATAAVLPARRAAAVDPATLLRHE